MPEKFKIAPKNLFLLILVVSLAGLTAIVGCNQSDVAVDEVSQGKALAAKYCVSCHQLPDPALIDRLSWVQGVLPNMAGRLGVQSYMGQYFTDGRSVVNVVDWQKIVTYYKTASPENLVIPKPATEPLKDWAIFSLQLPKKQTGGPAAMTTLLAYNNFDQQFYSGDAANNFYRWDKDLRPTLVQKLASPVTGAVFSQNDKKGNEAVVTTIGVMAPIDVAKGQVVKINLDSKATDKNVQPIGEGLPRSVQSVAADFNKDGLTDYVVCGFGHEFGGLFLLQQQPDHSFKKSIIRNVPGGEQLIVGDFNNDGWPDVMGLFAQADEGIWMFLNDQKGGFITKNLLHFPSVYGSSSFQLVDFNHDGKPDILYTCGDNSDFSKVLKPYHGIYIFTNQGDWNFKQTYFYHINGCTKAIAADFEGNGKLDIAAIAFFADFKYHPAEGFRFLQQQDEGKFVAHELPIAQYGRWLTMEIGDIDHDGKPDIILGNFSTPGRGLLNQAGVKPGWDQHIPLIVLKNISAKK